MTKDNLQTYLSFLFLLCFALSIFGCSSEHKYVANDTSIAPAILTESRKESLLVTIDDSESFALSEIESSDEDLVPNSAPKPPSNRKVIYKSNLFINVNTFDGVDGQVNQLVNQYSGFVANANLDHLQGKRRKGYWQIRIPVENYHSFMSTIGDIGTVVKRNEEASDVTAEFYDLEARIKNKQRLEERIAGLLAEANGNLSRLIEVEHELARVREEIERMQGRKRLLKDVTSLTTIDIHVQEIDAYEPVQATAFNDRIDNAWTSAVTQATEMGQNLIVTVVRNAINVAAILVSLFIVWLAYRIFFRKRAVATTAT